MTDPTLKPVYFCDKFRQYGSKQEILTDIRKIGFILFLLASVTVIKMRGRVRFRVSEVTYTPTTDFFMAPNAVKFKN